VQEGERDGRGEREAVGRMQARGDESGLSVTESSGQGHGKRCYKGGRAGIGAIDGSGGNDASTTEDGIRVTTDSKR